MQPLLQQLQNKHWVWRGQGQMPGRVLVASGLEPLDTALGGGLPAVGVVTVQSPPGIGELRLLWQYLETGRELLVFINAPGRLNGVMLAHQKLALSRVLVITPKTAKDPLWAAELCLKSGCCSRVILWSNALQVHQVKRLQLAAEQGQASILIFSAQRGMSALPATLSLVLSPAEGGVRVEVMKHRGGWPVPAFYQPLTKRWPRLAMPSPLAVKGNVVAIAG